MNLALSMVLLLLSAAPDKDAQRLAAKSFRQAEEAFGRREFSEAAVGFEKAARWSPHPTAWLNACESWERAGELVRAREDCVRALAMKDIARRLEAEGRRRLARIDAKLAPRVTADSTATSTSLPNGTSLPLAVAEVAASAQTTTIAAPALDPPALVPSDESTVFEDEPHVRAPPLATWIAFGFAGASGAVAATFGGLTLNAKSDFNADPTQARADTFFARRLTTNVALALMAIGVGAGVVVWAVDDDSAASSPAEAAITLSADAGALVLGLVIY